MGSKDDLFGSDGKTVLRSRPSEEQGAQDRPAQRIDAPAAQAARDHTVFDPGGAPPQGWSTDTVIDIPGAASPIKASKSSAQAPNNALLVAFAGVSYSSPNPITASAAPLLMLFGDLRLIAAERNTDALSRHVAGAIREFDRKISEAGVPTEDARISKYVLCETADDLIGNLPGIDRKAWLEDGMLARFFNTAAAGSGFFDALNKVLENPEAHYNLLELMHACLSLGFEGQYRNRSNARESLQRVRRDVYETLRYFRDRAGDEISPSWQGLSATMAPKRRRLPMWAIVAAMPAVLAAAFFTMRIIITDRADAVAEQLLALTPSEAVTIQHAEFAPVVEAPAVEPPPVVDVPRTTQIDRIRQALAEDIAGGSVKVATRGDFIVIQINNLVLFDSGKADVKAAFEPLAERIAAALGPEPGPVRILGHTDNIRPSRCSVFKSNHDLSVARAQAVERIVKPKLSDPSRVEVAGKGDEEPIADNATPEGRAHNRRVDVMIQKEETL